MLGAYYSSFVILRRFLLFSVLTLLFPRIFLRVQTIVSGSLGQIKYKAIQNFCGVVGSFLICIADVCFKYLKIVSLSDVRVCPNFWLEKSWSLCSEEHLSHHTVIISSGAFLLHQTEKSSRTKATTCSSFILSACKCLGPSQVLGTDCWTQSGIHHDPGGRVLAHISHDGQYRAGTGPDFPWRERDGLGH